MTDILRMAGDVAPMPLADFVALVDERLDLDDPDSLLAFAEPLHALAQDRELLVRHLNALVERQFRGRTIASAQAILLAETPRFYVRAAVWPAQSDIAAGRVYQGNFAYDAAHDHNFSFLTVNYSGPGYVTELYECDPSRIVGYVGEHVELEPLGSVQFGPGMVMRYRPHCDVHVQRPPQEMSVSLNLLIATPEMRMREQYWFDTETGTITGYGEETDGTRRVSLMEIASLVGDGNTRALVEDLMLLHPAPRTRLAAAQAALALGADAETVLHRMVADPDELVRRAARSALQRRERG